MCPGEHLGLVPPCVGRGGEVSEDGRGCQGSRGVLGAPVPALLGIPELGEAETTSGYCSLYTALGESTQCSTAGIKLNGSCCALGLFGLPFVILFYLVYFIYFSWLHFLLPIKREQSHLLSKMPRISCSFFLRYSEGGRVKWGPVLYPEQFLN